MRVIIERPSPEEMKAKGVCRWPIWEKEVSAFPWFYDTAEQCYFLEGEVVVTDRESGERYEIRAGDFVTFPAGLSCSWEVRKPVRKHYRFD